MGILLRGDSSKASSAYEIWTLEGLRILESEDRYATKLHEQIVKGAIINRSSIVLDIGCGSGFLSFEAAKYAKLVVACDLSKELLEYILEKSSCFSGNVFPLCSDAMELPFPDSSFDAVLAGWILHESPNRINALNEWTRVLKNGGNWWLEIKEFQKTVLSLTSTYPIEVSSDATVSQKSILTVCISMQSSKASFPRK